MFIWFVRVITEHYFWLTLFLVLVDTISPIEPQEPNSSNLTALLFNIKLVKVIGMDQFKSCENRGYLYWGPN